MTASVRRPRGGRSRLGPSKYATVFRPMCERCRTPARCKHCEVNPYLSDGGSGCVADRPTISVWEIRVDLAAFAARRVDCRHLSHIGVGSTARRFMLPGHSIISVLQRSVCFGSTCTRSAVDGDWWCLKLYMHTSERHTNKPTLVKLYLRVSLFLILIICWQCMHSWLQRLVIEWGLWEETSEMRYHLRMPLSADDDCNHRSCLSVSVCVLSVNQYASLAQIITAARRDLKDFNPARGSARSPP